MTIGLITGMGHLIFAAFVTVLGCVLLFVLNKIPLFDKNKQEKILKITIPEDLDYTTVFDEIFKQYTTKVELEQVKTTNMGSMFELSYRITFNKGMNERVFWMI